MTKLLYIKASPRTGSRSIAVADAYLNALAGKNPDLVVETISLWTEPLPAFDGDKVAAKLNVFGGAENEGVYKSAWDEIVAVATRFASMDRYLFAIPMWNGGIPYRLKHYIDLVHQPGITFGFDPARGYIGLLANKQATLVYTSGSFAPEVPPAFGTDHQSTYMRAWLNQAGVTDLTEIRYQPTLMSQDQAGDLARAKERAEAAA